MIDIAVNFYKELFAKESRIGVSLDKEFWEPDDLLTNEENELITKPFTEEEIKEVVFSCYSDGTRGLMACRLCFTKGSGILLKMTC
jgi:CRISPR/Cas system CMR-associated protein Cmr3 (group 5 of RAMP superfamily)